MPSLDPIIEEIHLQNDDPSPFSSRDSFPFSSSIVILSDTAQNGVADQKRENSDTELFQGIEEELENLMKHSGIPHQQGESREDFIHTLKKKRRGFVVTSFSRLQKEREHGERSNPGRDSNFNLPHFEARAEDDFEETREADEPESINAKSPASSKQADPSMLKLPGGASTGNFLHEILERIDYAQVLESNSAEEWVQNSGV